MGSDTTKSKMSDKLTVEILDELESHFMGSTQWPWYYEGPYPDLVRLLVVHGRALTATAREGHKLQERIKQLETAIKKVINGDHDVVRTTIYRSDGQHSKHDQCPHKKFIWEGCEDCVCDFLRTALDEEIDTSDIPEADEEWFKKARLVKPEEWSKRAKEKGRLDDE
jgi:hypothetical protein